MSFWILAATGEQVSRTTVQRVTDLELSTNDYKEKTSRFDRDMADLLHAQTQSVTIPPDVDLWLQLTQENDAEMNASYMEGRDSGWLKDQDFNTEPGQPTGDLTDNYVNMEIALPRSEDGQLHSACVKRRAIDQDGRPIRVANNNPMLDTRRYVVQYLDGTAETLTANTIATNLFAQVDQEGRRQLLAN